MKGTTPQIPEGEVCTQELLRLVEEFFDAIERGEIDSTSLDPRAIAQQLDRIAPSITPTITPSNQDDPHHESV
jgi:hypothetical protein